MDRIDVMELARSFQCGLIDRRIFLSRATKALGSAAAAGMLLTACQHSDEDNPPPVVEAPQRDDTETAVVAGLVTGMVDYPDGEEGTLMGYLARPEEQGSHPGVIVIQEWWGLNEHIKDLTRRFAQAGYVALAPDLYHGVVTSEPDEARKLVMQLDRDAAVSEIGSAIEHLLAQDYVAGPKLGTVGFCMGGWLVLQTAIDNEKVGASVAFYGSPLSDEEVARVKAPVMGNYGSLDGGIPVERVKQMEAALNAAGIENDIKVFEGAQHAFFNDTRPSYHEAASKEAWSRTLGWFEKYLSAS